MPTRIHVKLMISQWSSVTTTAISIAVAPKKFPRLAVFGELSNLSPKMNSAAATRYVALMISPMFPPSLIVTTPVSGGTSAACGR